MATLADVLSDIHRSKNTGLLSITISNDNNQFKVYFLNGDIYHLTYGGKQDAECLQNCTGYNFSSCFFLPNFRLESKKAALPGTVEIIARFGAHTGSIEVKHSDGRALQPTGMTPEIGAQYARMRDGLKVALIRQIGPAGGKVFSKIVEEKWRVASPGKADFQNLVALLSTEIDDADNQKQFRSEAEKIISS